MANLHTGSRKRLNDLLQIILDTFDQKTKDKPKGDGLLPDHDRFLAENKIRLIEHDFEKADSESGQPPVLFNPCSPSILVNQYPVQFDLITDEAHRKTQGNYPDYDHSFSNGSLWFTTQCSRYLYSWAYGGRIRKRPEGFPGMASAFGFDTITADHSLLLGCDIFDSSKCEKYVSDVLEYNRGMHGLRPHLIILGAQEQEGKNGLIMLGELMLILAAMRNRAFQASLVQEGEEGVIEAIIRYDSDLLFNSERKFPVLMVSIVAPHNARIYYACMDDKEELVIL